MIIVNANLIDITEMLAEKKKLNFSRLSDNEIFISLRGKGAEYNISVILKQDYELIYFSGDMGLVVPEEKYLAITDALAKVNERIWIGHFDFLSSEKRIIYSVTIPYISFLLADEEIIDSTLQLIVDECDRFYDYFYMVIGNHELSDLSIGTLFLESAGEA